MDNIFLVSGVACLIAAVVGGGLKAFGIEIPALSSLGRQVALGVLGLILVAVGRGNLFPGGTIDPVKPTPQPARTAPSILTGPISVNVNSNPRTVPPGGSTEISVFATANDGSVVSDAQVVVSAGGGVFQATGGTKVVGTTDEKGVFHTIWRTYEPGAYSGDLTYVIGVSVTKDGLDEGKGELQVFVRK